MTVFIYICTELMYVSTLSICILCDINEDMNQDRHLLYPSSTQLGTREQIKKSSAAQGNKPTIIFFFVSCSFFAWGSNLTPGM